jgi:hypothetical protein
VEWTAAVQFFVYPSELPGSAETNNIHLGPVNEVLSNQTPFPLQPTLSILVDSDNEEDDLDWKKRSCSSSEEDLVDCEHEESDDEDHCSEDGNVSVDEET